MNIFTQALDRSRFAVDAARNLLTVRFAAIQEGCGFWGAAHWATRYSLTAAAIALILIIRAFVIGAQYAYATGFALGEWYAARRSAPNLLLLPVLRPVRLLQPAAVQLQIAPATVKLTLALPPAKITLALPPAKSEPAKKRGRKPALTTEQKQALCQRRRDGAGYEVLCAEFGVSRSTVKRLLRAA